MYHAVKSFIFAVSGVKIIIYQNRFPQQGSPKTPEPETLIHPSAFWGVVWNQARIGIQRLREPHQGYVFIFGISLPRQHAPK